MATLTEAKARKDIRSILTILGAAKGGLKQVGTLTGGKLYELYVLSRLLLELQGRGFQFNFSGKTIAFKTGGGPIKAGDFHIDVLSNGHTIGKIYTDVEVRTLGWSLNGVMDLSQYHESDIVIVRPSVTGYPKHDDVLLTIECKATAKFDKSHVRESLGRRRELSYYSKYGLAPPLSPGSIVFADPPSEFWLCFIDPAGLNYAQSPAVFSVELRHWQP